MKYNFKNYFLIYYAVGIALIFFGCSNEETQKEADKLIKKQAKIHEKKKNPINNTIEQSKVNEGLVKTGRHRALIKTEKSSDNTENKGTRNKKVQKQGNVNEQIRPVDNDADISNKGYERLHKEVDGLVKKEDSIIHVVGQTVGKDLLMREKLAAEIEIVDSRLELLERELLIKQKEISINEQRILLAKRNMELLEDEKSIYLLKKNEVLKSGGDAIELEHLDLKMSGIETMIANEKNSIQSLETNTISINDWIRDANELKKKLIVSIEEAYDKNKSKDIKSKQSQESKEIVGQRKSDLDLQREPALVSVESSDNLKDGQLAKEVLFSAKEITKTESFDDKTQNPNTSLELEDDKEFLDSKKVGFFKRLFRMVIIVGIILIIVLYFIGKRKLENDKV